ncbi:MAG: serine/threonine protein phosphatase [Pirellulaceae bacterium]
MRRALLLILTAVSIRLLLFGGSLTGAAEKLTPAPEGTFSVVVIPDTQAYAGAGTKGDSDSTAPVTNRIFAAHTQWIANNLQRQRIAFVSHVGDIVDINVESQWEVARRCMDTIHGQVPYGISVGNHDMTSRGDSTLFQQYFPRSRFESFAWYGESYGGSPAGKHISGDNANSFQLFSAEGLDFVFLHLECNAPDDVLEWANGILAQHAGRLALITSHMGWGPRARPVRNEEYISAPKGRMTWHKVHGERGNSPQQIWEKCYQHHPHLVAVFSGDQSRTQAYRAASPGRHGNVVHEFMQDYGSGWLRMYRFHPRPDRVHVEAITFHPVTEELCEGVKLVPAREEHQFTFEFPLHQRIR